MFGLSNPSNTVIYWEKQGPDQLCGVHCVNSLLQGPFFNEIELASIARELDDKEKQLMAAQGEDSKEYLQYLTQDSQNVADDGNYSIQVLQEALKKLYQLTIESVDSQINKQQDLSTEIGFICNSDSHWFTIRRVNQVWYNLNSTNRSGPEPISDFYLSAFLMSVKENGYNIFVVRGNFPNSDKDSQRYFTLEQIKTIQEAQKLNKKFGLNIDGNDQEQLDKVLEESLKTYNQEQDKQEGGGFSKKFDGEQAEKEEDKFKPFQGQGIAMHNDNSSLGEIESYFTNQEVYNEDPELKMAIRLSMLSKYDSRPTSGIIIQFRLPNGSKKDWTFNPTDTIRELYDFIVANQEEGQEYKFILVQNYPKMEFGILDITLGDAGLGSNTALIVSKR